MALRRRVEGVFVIEQTRELDRVATILSAAAMTVEGLRWPAACYLMGWLGPEPAGVIGIEPIVTTAVIRSLVVVESMRGRGFGRQLFAAARKAALTRGVRELYTLAPAGNAWFGRLGFLPVAIGSVSEQLHGFPLMEHYRNAPDRLAAMMAWRLDISCDGIIER